MYLSIDDDVTKLNIENGDQFPLILKKIPDRRRKRSVRYNEENRIMSKRGRINVYLNKIPDKSIRYVRDLWNTLVNTRWRWILLTVALVNVIAYSVFAGFFLFDAWISGDFANQPGHKTCIKGVNGFTSFFMLGIETITTTGYGYFHPTEHCQVVWIVLTCSTLVTIFIDGAFISVVYVKISRPKVWPNIFSKKAVISLRNQQLCLVFRINDSTGKHWINSRVKLYLVKHATSAEGEPLPNFIIELKLKPYGALFWPLEVVHEIAPDSPFWCISAKDLMTNKFELLATITGSSVLTGQSSKSQTSYLGKEILWGHWFNNCLEFNLIRNEYVVSRSNFNKTNPHDTPLCSAQHLKKVRREIRRKPKSVGFFYLSDHQT